MMCIPFAIEDLGCVPFLNCRTILILLCLYCIFDCRCQKSLETRVLFSCRKAEK